MKKQFYIHYMYVQYIMCLFLLLRNKNTRSRFLLSTCTDHWMSQNTLLGTALEKSVAWQVAAKWLCNPPKLHLSKTLVREAALQPPELVGQACLK